jgi:hypothetical protein
MDKLKGILAKKKEKAQQAVGDRKWVKRAELEQLERPAVSTFCHAWPSLWCSS